MNIAVVGLGKIGLPLAVQYAGKGHDVVGVDINEDLIAVVNDGHEPFPGEEHLAEALGTVVREGRLSATSNYGSAIPTAEVVIVVVPLFVDDETWLPDFGPMDAATADIARHMTADTLVIYETTLPVGTTRTRWRPALESGSGMAEGQDFHVAFSPERVLTGRIFADLRKYPKLVGGLSQEGANRAGRFYEEVLDFDDRPDLQRPNGVWDLGSAEAAELSKLAETTYRDVNIALANQFALFAETHGIDVHQVIEASNSQPYSHIHRPGIAVGGHCIPVYPRLYLWNDPEATVVRAAREANAIMPERVVDRLEKVYGSLSGARVAVLGASYRGGVKETAFSGIFPTVHALERKGAVVRVHDPMYSPTELAALGLTPYEVGQEVDAAVVQADHGAFGLFGPEHLPGVKVIADGRKALDPRSWPSVKVVTTGQAQTSDTPPHAQ